MEHTGASRKSRVNSHSQPNEHVTELADRRESRHTLEVRLRECTQCSIEGGYATNPGDNLEGLRASRGKERVGACHHVDASRDHCCCMDQCAYRCGAFHSWRQSDMQRELGRFANGTA